MESWLVEWRDQRDQEQRREFATFMEAWDFNESALKGRGGVTMLTDRPLASDSAFKNEAAAARRIEGKYAARKK